MASYTTSRYRIDELSRQTRAASKYSMLDADAEQALFRLWRNRHDMAAAQLLVASHLPLVVGIERRFRGYGLSPEELIGEAWVGLMRAVCRFDPDCGFSFATYATWWVRAAVQEFILRNWSSVSLGTTRAQRKLFLNLRHMHNKLRAADHGPLSNEQVSRISG